MCVFVLSCIIILFAYLHKKFGMEIGAIIQLICLIAETVQQLYNGPLGDAIRLLFAKKPVATQ